MPSKSHKPKPYLTSEQLSTKRKERTKAKLKELEDNRPELLKETRELNTAATKEEMDHFINYMIKFDREKLLELLLGLTSNVTKLEIVLTFMHKKWKRTKGEVWRSAIRLFLKSNPKGGWTGDLKGEEGEKERQDFLSKLDAEEK